MTITFFTNFINHHQVYVADEIYRLIGNQYHVVVYSPLPDSFRHTGYPDFYDRPYIIKRYASDSELKKATELESNSDVVIIGSMHCPFLKKRAYQHKKITFYYNERWFKKSKWRILNPRTLRWLYNNHVKYNYANVFMLCASAFTPVDANFFRLYRGRCFKWGYFPDVIKYNDIENILSKKSNITIVWCARFIDWKHPEIPIKVALALRERGLNFNIEMIGSGEKLPDIVKMVKKYNLNDYVQVLGNMPTTDVRKHMLKAGIFMFTSDKNEGWGAVLNEAMNSACAVVADSRIGSAPFLIKDKLNGFLYNNVDNLILLIDHLLKNPAIQMGIGKAAFHTMTNMWNPQNAASRLVCLSENLIDGTHKELYSDGPCSIADVLHNNWYNKLKLDNSK